MSLMLHRADSHDPMFSRRGRSPYRIHAGVLLTVLLALAVDVFFFAPPWWMR